MNASIEYGAYLLIPFTCGLAVLGTYVVKAYIQYLRELHDAEDDITEEDKLRAFDRTTWDNRESALENIRNPPVLFTDTFRWTLCKEDIPRVETLFASSTPAPEDLKIVDQAATLAADSSSSEEPHEHEEIVTAPLNNNDYALPQWDDDQYSDDTETAV